MLRQSDLLVPSVPLRTPQGLLKRSSSLAHQIGWVRYPIAIASELYLGCQQDRIDHRMPRSILVVRRFARGTGDAVPNLRQPSSCHERCGLSAAVQTVTIRDQRRDQWPTRVSPRTLSGYLRWLSSCILSHRVTPNAPVTGCRPNRNFSCSPRTASGRQYGAVDS